MNAPATGPSVRCYCCGRRTDPRQSCCARCGAVLSALCEGCGKTLSIYAPLCDCGRARTPEAWRRRRPVFLLVLLAVLLAGAGAFLARRQLRGDESYDRWLALRTAHEEYYAERFPEAAVRFGRILEEYGEAASVRLMRGLSLYFSGRRAEGLADCRRALEADPDLDGAALLLARDALLAARHGEALAFAEQALASGERPPLAHYIVGRVLARPEYRDVPRAMWHLEQAVAARIDEPDALLLFAELLLLSERAYPGTLRVASHSEMLLGARRRADSLLAEDPGNAEARFFISRCALALGDLEAALTNYRAGAARRQPGFEELLLRARLEHAQRNDPGADRILRGLLEEDGGAERRLRVAEVYREISMPEAAEQTVAEGLATHPEDPGLLLQRARDLLDRGDAPGAEAALRQAAAMSPREPLLGLWLAEALRSQPGRAAEAEAMLRGITAKPRAPLVTRLRLADMLLDPPRDRGLFGDRIREAREILEGAGERLIEGDPLRLYREQVEGKLLLREGRTEEAIARLSEVTSRDPGDPVPHVLLAEAHEGADQPDLAFLEWSAAIRLTRRAPELLLRRARVALAAGGAPLAEAKRDLLEILRDRPEDEEALLLLARVRLAADAAEREEAGRDLERAAALPGAGPDALLELAALDLAAGRVEEARARLDEAERRAAGPEDRARIVAARALLEDRAAGGRVTPAARAVFEDALHRHPEDRRVRLRYARVLLEAGDLPAARRELEVLLSAGDDPAPLRLLFEVEAAARAEAAADPGAPAALPGIVARLEAAAPESVDLLYLRGRLALAAGDAEGAEALLAEAFGRNPRDEYAALALGTARLIRGDADGAVGALSRAVRLRPDLAAPRLLLAEAWFRQAVAEGREDRREKAVGRLRLALAQDPGHVGALALLARSLATVGAEGSPEMLRQAENAAARLAARLAESGAEPAIRAQALSLLATVRIALGDAAGATAAGRESAALAPDDAEILLRSALVFLGAGQAAEAAVLLARAADAAPARRDVLLLLAESEARAGRAAEGAARLRGWLAAHPGDAPAWTCLGTLAPERTESAAAFREALRLAPDDPGVPLAAAETLLPAGGAAEAEALLREALERAGMRGDVLVHLARAVLAAGRDTGEGEELLREAAGEEFAAPENRMLALVLHLRRLAANGRAEEAMAAARRLLGTAPDPREVRAGTRFAALLAEGYALAGTALHVGGQYEAAELSYRRSLAFGPREDLVQNNLAELLLDGPTAGRSEVAVEAERLARAAVGRRGDRPQYRDTLGRALLAAGRPEDARAEFERAIALQPAPGEGVPETDDAREVRGRALLGIAESFWAQGNAESAREVLRAAEEASPGLGRERRSAALREKLAGR